MDNDDAGLLVTLRVNAALLAALDRYRQRDGGELSRRAAARALILRAAEGGLGRAFQGAAAPRTEHPPARRFGT